MNISELKVGDKFIIKDINQRDPSYRARLAAMGLVLGRECVLSKTAPTGDPVIIEVGDLGAVTLRLSESKDIMIELCK